MSKARPSPPKADQPIFRTLVFFIICTSIAYLLSFPSISQAGLFSKEKTDEVGPISPEAQRHLELGLRFFDEGDIDSAINEFKKAIELNPDYADAHNNLGTAYGTKGLYDLAIRQYEEAIRLEA